LGIAVILYTDSLWKSKKHPCFFRAIRDCTEKTIFYREDRQEREENSKAL